ncbi:hypothetical protein [Azospirillum argentinense]|uniref:hypothetical protein n=1 Tax=Azospirillum argentinense TaxID=2970906 RepID=UPI0032DE42CD
MAKLYDERDLIEEFHHHGELAAVLLRRDSDEVMYRIIDGDLVERRRFPLRQELVELFALRDADAVL